MAFSKIASVLLILLTVISYVPQYHRIFTLRSSAGISITSVLLATLVAQVQACTMYYLAKSTPDLRYGVPFASPLSNRDWLNLIQILVQWVCSVMLLILVIHFPASLSNPSAPLPASSDRERFIKIAAVVLWILHVFLFALSVVAGGRPVDLVFNIVRNINADVINPIFTLLAAVAFVLQTRVLPPADQLNVLSRPTLYLQCVTFTLLAISWPFRLLLPPNMWAADHETAVLTQWYPWVGWACVNNAIFAIGQGAILLFVTEAADGRIRLVAADEL